VNLLRELVDSARETIQSGYYRPNDASKAAPSLVKAIEKTKTDGRRAIIAELKPATPTKGKLIEGGLDGYLARFIDEGACAISALTEPKHFHGSIALMRKAVATRRPVLMKDFIIAEEQIDCAAHHGAAAILLIAAILPKKRIQTLIEYAHLADREVLLEVANDKEYQVAMASEADLVGINNRDLRTFEVDLERTNTIAKSAEKEKPLVSLSGFRSRADLDKVAAVADAYLVGSALLEGETTVQELVAP
jgi:indole-3-glycerol phosphate synthase